MAAEQDEVVAQLNLGLMYFIGRGVPQDFVQAHMWLNLAASYPLCSSLFPEECKEAARNRDVIAKFMTSVQIAEAQRLAREWVANARQ